MEPPETAPDRIEEAIRASGSPIALLRKASPTFPSASLQRLPTPAAISPFASPPSPVPLFSPPARLSALLMAEAAFRACLYRS